MRITSRLFPACQLAMWIGQFWHMNLTSVMSSINHLIMASWSYWYEEKAPIYFIDNIDESHPKDMLYPHVKVTPYTHVIQVKVSSWHPKGVVTFKIYPYIIQISHLIDIYLRKGYKNMLTTSVYIFMFMGNSYSRTSLIQINLGPSTVWIFKMNQ